MGERGLRGIVEWLLSLVQRLVPYDVDGELFRKAVFGTYWKLRIGMAGLAFVFPIWLFVVGSYWYDLPLQGAMSAYYWASVEGDPPMRVWFVGFIFAIGTCLWLYKGYSKWENRFLNVAAGCIILVALFPMSWKCGADEPVYCAPSAFNQFTSSLHSVFAYAFFVCTGWVAAVESQRTVSSARHANFYRWSYVVLALLLIILPGIVVYLHHLRKIDETWTFWMEVGSIAPFTFFWFLKTVELHRSQIEKEVLEYPTSAGSTPANRS